MVNARLQLWRQTLSPPVKYSTMTSLLGAAEAATIKQQITKKPVRENISFNYIIFFFEHLLNFLLFIISQLLLTFNWWWIHEFILLYIAVFSKLFHLFVQNICTRFKQKKITLDFARKIRQKSEMIVLAN